MGIAGGLWRAETRIMPWVSFLNPVTQTGILASQRPFMGR